MITTARTIATTVAITIKKTVVTHLVNAALHNVDPTMCDQRSIGQNVISNGERIRVCAIDMVAGSTFQQPTFGVGLVLLNVVDFCLDSPTNTARQFLNRSWNTCDLVDLHSHLQIGIIETTLTVLLLRQLWSIKENFVETRFLVEYSVVLNQIRN